MSKIKVRVNGKVLSFPEGTPEQEMQEAMEQFLLSEKSQPKKEEGGLYEKVVSKLNPLIEEKPLGLIARKLKGSALIPETTKELKREVVEQIPAAAGTASLMIPGAGAFIAPAAAGSGEYVKEKLLEEDVSPFLIAMQTGLNSFPLLGKTPLKNVAEGLAEKFALKVIKPTAKELKGLFHKGQSEKSIARTLLDNKILSGNTGKMLEKTQSALDETGQGIEGILKSVDDINLTKKTNISEPGLSQASLESSSTRVPSKLEETANFKEVPSSVKVPTKLKGEELADSLESVAQELEGSLEFVPSNFNELYDKINKIRARFGDAEVPFTDVNKVITEISNSIRNFGKENVGSQAVVRKGRTALVNKMKSKLDDIEQMLGGSNFPEAASLKQAKSRYSNLSTINEILEQTHAKEQAKSFLNPADTVSGVGAGAYTLAKTGNPSNALMAALSAPLVIRGLKKYSPLVIAKGANAAPKVGKTVEDVKLFQYLLNSLTNGGEND